MGDPRRPRGGRGKRRLKGFPPFRTEGESPAAGRDSPARARAFSRTNLLTDRWPARAFRGGRRERRLEGFPPFRREAESPAAEQGFTGRVRAFSRTSLPTDRWPARAVREVGAESVAWKASHRSARKANRRRPAGIPRRGSGRSQERIYRLTSGWPARQSGVRAWNWPDQTIRVYPPSQ